MHTGHSDDTGLDRSLQPQVFKLLPGRCHVATADEVITTLLGSCVAACIFDPMRGLGGMNHFLLPAPAPGEDATLPVSAGARYGAFAMETLINGLLTRGAARNRLRVKLFGGARILARLSDVGQRNIEFVRGFVALEQLPVVGEDLGGDQPRKLLMFPATGRVLVRRLPPVQNPTVGVVEARMLRTLDRPVGGTAELFP